MVARRAFVEQNPEAVSAFLDHYKDSVDYVLSNGKCHMNEMSAEEQAKMAKYLEPFKQNWISSMEKRGLTRAKEALGLFEKCMEEANVQYGAK